MCLVQQIHNVRGAGLLERRCRIAVDIIVHGGRGQAGNTIAPSPDGRGLLARSVDLRIIQSVSTSCRRGRWAVQIVPGRAVTIARTVGQGARTQTSRPVVLANNVRQWRTASAGARVVIVHLKRAISNGWLL